MKGKIKSYRETNEYDNTTYQNLCTAKAIIRRKFISLQVYLKKQDNPQLNKLSLHIKDLEKEQKEPKVSRRKKLI